MSPMSSRQNIVEELTPIFRRVFDDDSLELRDSMSAQDVTLWDSLNHINLIVSVEKKFGIKFKTSEVTGLANVGEFIDAIQSKISSRG